MYAKAKPPNFIEMKWQHTLSNTENILTLLHICRSAVTSPKYRWIWEAGGREGIRIKRQEIARPVGGGNLYCHFFIHQRVKLPTDAGLNVRAVHFIYDPRLLAIPCVCPFFSPHFFCCNQSKAPPISATDNHWFSLRLQLFSTFFILKARERPPFLPYNLESDTHPLVCQWRF